MATNSDDIKRIKCIVAGGVNCRASYSMSSERIGSCNIGDEFQISRVYVGSDYVWYQVSWGGQTVWFPAGPGHAWFSIIEAGDEVKRTDADYSNSSAVAPWVNTDPVKEKDHLYTNGATPDQVKITGAEGDFFADLDKDKEFSITDIPGSLKAFWDKIFNAPKKYDITSLNSIIGMPFQFINTTDPRIGKDMQYGRLFSENIVMNLPIATIIPGAPRFLTGDNVTKKDREGIVGALAGAVTETGDDISKVLDNLLDGKNARYYSFQTQYTQYMEYVNTLCRLSAQYLGIGDKEYRAGVKYKNFDWKTEKVEDDGGTFIENLLGYTQCINVCYKPASSMQESSSNSTDQSALASMLSGVSDKAKEADFLFGAGAGIALDRMSPTYAEQQIDDIAKLVNNGSPSVFSRIFGRGKEAFSTVISGSNMVFPEIWKNSNFSRSYQLEVKLSSPYGDPESIYLYVLRPLWFLMCLGFPRSFGPNGITSPFIIQAHSKGVFNCELGIVDSIAIHRGAEGDLISAFNLPLDIDVTIAFKDLYDSLAITKSSTFAMLANNIGLLDYVATLAGISTNKPDLERKLDIFISSKLNSLRDIPGNIKNRISDALRDSILQWTLH